MKKLVFVFSIIIMSYGCNNVKKVEPTPTAKESNVTTTREAPSLKSCFYPIVINDTKLPSGWEYDPANKDYICYKESGKYYVDIMKFNDNVVKASWLNVNGTHINYPESYRSIEYIHRIKDIDNIPAASYTATTFQSIKDQIGSTYENDCYQSYIRFEIQQNGQIRVRQFGRYSYNQGAFSIPLLRSLENIHHLKPKDTIEFAEVTYNGKLTTIIRLLKDPEKTYDYSDEPSKREYKEFMKNL